MINLKKKICLKKYNTWKTGGLAEFFFEPHSIGELIQGVLWAKENKKEITVLGWGSNCLISDEGIPGLTISTGLLNNYSEKFVNKTLYIEAECGVKKSKLFRSFFKNELSPALFISGIPGNIGGGVVMNAGVSDQVEPKEFAEITEWIDVISLKDENYGEVDRYSSDDLVWKYRACIGWQPGIVVRAGFNWPLNFIDGLSNQVHQIRQKRLMSQPLSEASCGSVFVNPKGFKSAKLIDELGLKGTKIGGAMVSNKHANFIVNTGEASSMDIHLLIMEVKSKVFQEHNVQLETEVKYLGVWS